MLFAFEAFSLGLSDLGTITDFKTLFASILQVIAMIRSHLAISSDVHILFESFAPVSWVILSSFCSTVGMM